MQVHTEEIAASPIIYMRRIGAYGEQNFKIMQDMKNWIKTHNLWNENGIMYGIAQDNVVVTPPEQCRYDVCFVTEQTFDDSTIHNGVLPSGEYLVFEILHTVDEVKSFWGSIGDILTKEKRQIDESRPILERYQFALVENGYCEFCIPILN